MAGVQLSIEEFISGFQVDDSFSEELLVLDTTPSNGYVGFHHSIDRSPCDALDYIDPRDYNIDKQEFNSYFPNSSDSGGVQVTTNGIYHSVTNNSIPSTFKHLVPQTTQAIPTFEHVSLSRSVTVTAPKNLKNPSHSIEIVNGLEPTHKARYKSDYFSQHGTVRKPRYVADEKGNHFVTIKVVPNAQGIIRVDWVTIPNEKDVRYSMPYMFQQSNESAEIPDCNPIYQHINADRFGMMKIYLVLIRSKQEELKKIQALEKFPPCEHYSEVMDHTNCKEMSSLAPKRLIETYRLDKSQLAFTFCSLSPDGQLCAPEWDTTVYSTVLTEISSDTSKKRKATCPNCSYSFDMPTDDMDDIGHEKIVKRRKKTGFK